MSDLPFPAAPPAENLRDVTKVSQPDPRFPTTGCREGHPDRLRRPPYTVAVVGPRKIARGFVAAKLATLLARKFCTHRVEIQGELVGGDITAALVEFAHLRQFNPTFFAAGAADGRYASARLAVQVLDGADALVIFDDASRDYRFYSWVAGKCGLRVEVIRVVVSEQPVSGV